MVSQHMAVNRDALGQLDRVKFWRAQRYDALECLSASFHSHKYAPHTHDTYVVGTIVGGCEQFTIGGVLYRAKAGDLVFVNPGEVHDGEPGSDHFAYRMTYPSVGLVKSLAVDLFYRNKLQAPHFREPVVHDPDMAELFANAHKALEKSGNKLEADTAFVTVLSMLLTRYSDYGPARELNGVETGPIRRVKDYLDAYYAEDVELAELAEIAGLSRHYLIRAFRKATGMTPHAYLTDRRIDAARNMLRSGLSPADVALRCGFFDQSHLTKVFKARIGVTPGEFKAQ